MRKRGYPWPQCIGLGVLAAAVIAGITAYTQRTGVTLPLIRSFSENAALIAVFIRYVSESRDNSPDRLFRVMAISGLILAVNRLLFLALERVL